MLPPFFQTVDVPAVQAIFGPSKPLRIWLFGEAPEKESRPYVVWQVIPGSAPGLYINQRPDFDGWLVQVDVYAEAQQGKEADAIDQILAGAEALRDALEGVAHITAWRGTTREPGTRFYRYSFDVEFITSR